MGSGQEAQYGDAQDPGQQPPNPPSLSPLPVSLGTDASRVGQGPPMASDMVSYGPLWGTSHVMRAVSFLVLLLFELVRRSEGATVSLTRFSDICHPLLPPRLKKGRLSGVVETFYVLIVGVVKRGWYIIWQNSLNTTL